MTEKPCDEFTIPFPPSNYLVQFSVLFPAACIEKAPNEANYPHSLNSGVVLQIPIVDQHRGGHGEDHCVQSSSTRIWLRAVQICSFTGTPTLFMSLTRVVADIYPLA